MIQLSSALLEPPAPAPHCSEISSHPPSPPGSPFSSVLDDHQARTATAEGHQRPDTSRAPVADRDAHEPRVDADGDPKHERDGTAPAGPDSTHASALAALLGGVPLPAGVATTVVARLTVDAAATTATAAPAPGLPGASAPATAIPTGASVPAAASALPLRPAAGAAVADPTAAAATAGPSDTAGPRALAGSATAAAGVPSAAASVANALQAASARPAGAGVLDGAHTATTGQDAAAAAPAGAIAGAPAGGSAGSGGSAAGTADHAPAQTAPAPAPTATPTAAPASPTSTQPTQASSASPTPGVGLEHAVETVRLALRAAADRGVTHARISLTPRELGGIEVHLRQTADGLVARVVAEHTTAAQLLQQAGGDLRRSLESQGLTLLRLDIGASGEQGGRAPGDGRGLADGASGDGFEGRAGRNRATTSDDPLAALDSTTDPASSTTTLALSNGALVDVLA
ncbi:MAG TPA: flagellar hook-length control protein FliK [Conexibacter sp.]|jgi:flagellar hook-length control protein FliK|nr:flagellar hook-length control protein FliK [Conexibacter sp.]